MVLPPKTAHPKGEGNFPVKSEVFASIEVDTFDGKTRVEWEPEASVSSLGSG